MSTIEQTKFIEYNNKNNTKEIKLNNTKDTTREQIQNTLDANKITEKLAIVFWLNKEEVNILTQEDTIELADNMEVNKTSYQLAGEFERLLWKNNITSNMIALNNPDYVPVKSYAWVA